MESSRSGSVQVLGISGLVVGIIAFLVSFIPCVGILAIIPGILGIVLSSIGLSIANKESISKGLVVAALIISILATCIAVAWGYFFSKMINKDFQNEILDKINEGFNKSNDSTYNYDSVSNEIEEEEPVDELYVSSENTIDVEFDRLIEQYKEDIDNYVKFAKKVKKGDLDALPQCTESSINAANTSEELSKLTPDLTDKQKRKFQKLQKDFEEAIKDAEK